MWSHSRIRAAMPRAFAVLLIAAALPSCGFKPLHGQSQGGQDRVVARSLATIAVAGIPNRSGQVLRQLLQTDLTPRGAPPDPKSVLKVEINEHEARRSLDDDAFTSRLSLTVGATYRLIDVATGAVVTSGTESASVSFNIERRTEAIYSTIVSREDARRRALKEISRSIGTRLALFASAELERRKK